MQHPRRITLVYQLTKDKCKLIPGDRGNNCVEAFPQYQMTHTSLARSETAVWARIADTTWAVPLDLVRGACTG